MKDAMKFYRKYWLVFPLLLSDGFAASELGLVIWLSARASGTETVACRYRLPISVWLTVFNSKTSKRSKPVFFLINLLPI